MKHGWPVWEVLGRMYEKSPRSTPIAWTNTGVPLPILFTGITLCNGGRSRRGRLKAPSQPGDTRTRGRSVSAYAIIESERARTSLLRQGQRMDVAERRGELIVGGGFACAAVALAAVLRWGGTPIIGSLPTDGGAVCAEPRRSPGASGLMWAPASRCPRRPCSCRCCSRCPLALVPLLVALALVLGMTPAVLARSRPREPAADGARQQLVRGRARRSSCCSRTTRVPTALARRPAARAGRAVRVRLRRQRGARAPVRWHRACGELARGGARGLPDRRSRSPRSGWSSRSPRYSTAGRCC